MQSQQHILLCGGYNKARKIFEPYNLSIQNQLYIENSKTKKIYFFVKHSNMPPLYHPISRGSLGLSVEIYVVICYIMDYNVKVL